MAAPAPIVQAAPAADWPAPPFRELRTDRLVLRAMTLDDAPAAHAVLSDPDSMKYWYHLPHTSLEQTVERLREKRLAVSDAHRVWAITTDGGAWLGDITLFRMGDSPAGLLWLGYMLAPAARGKGYVVEAGRAVLDYGFTEWGAHRVEANLDPRNSASARVLERLGFRHEGHQRRNFRLGEEWTDTGIYGLLVEEWRAQRADAQCQPGEREA